MVLQARSSKLYHGNTDKEEDRPGRYSGPTLAKADVDFDVSVAVAAVAIVVVVVGGDVGVGL